MPIGRGVMQFDRLDIYETTSTLTSITPSGSAACGTSINFSVNVSNILTPLPRPTGNVFILDSLTGFVLGSGVLSSGSANVFISLPAGNIIPLVKYNGDINHTGSISSNSTVYNINPINTITTVTNTPSATFCSNATFNLTVHVVQSSGATAPTGQVRFLLYHDDINFFTIGDATLDASHNAHVTVSANLTTAGETYYIQAIYLGLGCFRASSNASGTGGIPIISISC